MRNRDYLYISATIALIVLIVANLNSAYFEAVQARLRYLTYAMEKAIDRLSVRADYPGHIAASDSLE